MESQRVYSLLDYKFKNSLLLNCNLNLKSLENWLVDNITGSDDTVTYIEIHFCFFRLLLKIFFDILRGKRMIKALFLLN